MKKRQKFSMEQELLHQILLHSNNTPAYGLMDGEMGIVLVLSEYRRCRRLYPLKTAINFLLDNVLGSLHDAIPLGFSHGLTGIGWGVEYLIQNRFQRGSGLEICEAIDLKLMSVNLKRVSDFSLESGLKGWFHYILAHVQGARIQGKEAFDASFLNDCLETGRRQAELHHDGEMSGLCASLSSMVNGGESTYVFDLRPFIRMSSPSSMSLGLENGLSGQLYNIINEETHT